MTEEEIRVRSVYLFMACSRAIEAFTDQLAATFPSAPLSSRLLLEKSVRRELAMLVRYWASRQIWQRLDAQEADAKAINIALLRLFTDGFKLPKDGSGLRYAELSTRDQECGELSRRIAGALGTEHQPLLAELERSITLWNKAVTTHTIDALGVPMEHLKVRVKAWAEGTPG